MRTSDLTRTGPRRRRLAAACLTAAVGILVAGCASPAPAAPAAATGGSPTASATASPTAAGLPTVAGYAVGQFPAVPLFELPDLSLLDSSLAGFTMKVEQKLPQRPGLDIRPAACGDATQRAAGRGTVRMYGDGSGTYTGPDGTIVNYGDGSGTYTVGGVTATVYGDGSGSYVGNGIEIHNYGDGSGSLTDASGTTSVYGDGSGSRQGSGITQWNYGDGSAMYSDGTVEIHNYGDGSGSYTARGIEIRNDGRGNGTVNGTPVQVAPLPREAPIGTFPGIGTLAPITSCGTTISLADGVLFDFDRDEVRADAASVLDELARTMTELGVPAAEIGGHTDSIGSDSENQALSERRAAAVVAALTQRSVAANLTAHGYGETAPVAANEVDGHDNPAGRQLNRRVEIFIPAF